jgi:hypothetical protein
MFSARVTLRVAGNQQLLMPSYKMKVVRRRGAIGIMLRGEDHYPRSSIIHIMDILHHHLEHTHPTTTLMDTMTIII